MGKKLILGWLMVCLAGAQPAWAHSEQAAVSVKTYTPIVVDGKLDDWVRRIEGSNWSAQLEIKKGNGLDWMRAAPVHVNVLTSHVEAGAVANPDDLSAVVSGTDLGGRYRVEWWDPYRGEIIGTAVSQARQGQVTLRVPVLTFDLAVKLVRMHWWEKS